MENLRCIDKLTHFVYGKFEMYGKFEKKNNSSVNIRFVDKTSDIRNFSQNIKSDVKTSDVATLLAAYETSDNSFEISAPKLSRKRS